MGVLTSDLTSTSGRVKLLDRMSTQRPEVFAYLDHRRFLSDWFDWRKASNPRFSHRLFARLAGQSSPSLLMEVIQGRRNLTSATTAAFVRAMALSPEEAEFFGLLVELDRAESDEARNRVVARIQGSRHFQAARRIEGAAFAYLSSWYIPAIRELALCPGFRADPAWIAATLIPRITTAQAQAALDTLISLGMLQFEADGRVVVVEATVATAHEVAGLAAHNYHRGMLARAAEGIETFRPTERHLGSLTVAVPSALLPQLKKALAEFQERMLCLCDGAEGVRDRVLQIGLQIVPLSQVVEPKREEER